MDTIIPFAKEVLNHRPSWGFVKIYSLGFTLAVLGAVGGLLEMVFLPFGERETEEVTPVVSNKEKKEVLFTPHTDFLHLEVMDVLETLVIKAKVRHVMLTEQRSSVHRLHAT